MSSHWDQYAPILDRFTRQVPLPTRASISIQTVSATECPPRGRTRLLFQASTAHGTEINREKEFDGVTLRGILLTTLLTYFQEAADSVFGRRR